MGFLDKLQQSAKETLDKGKEKLDDVQAERAADKLLRDLGAWYYAGRTGRDDGEAAANVERIVADLQAHEAQHGQLGAKAEPPAPPAPEAAGPPPSAPPSAPPAAPPSAPPAAPPAAPPSAGPGDAPSSTPPVTSGPPPPPPVS